MEDDQHPFAQVEFGNLCRACGKAVATYSRAADADCAKNALLQCAALTGCFGRADANSLEAAKTRTTGPNATRST